MVFQPSRWHYGEAESIYSVRGVPFEVKRRSLRVIALPRRHYTTASTCAARDDSRPADAAEIRRGSGARHVANDIPPGTTAHAHENKRRKQTRSEHRWGPADVTWVWDAISAYIEGADYRKVKRHDHAIRLYNAAITNHRPSWPISRFTLVGDFASTS